MPVFEIETPAGSFEVEAPDEATALNAVRQFATPRRGHNAPEFRPIGVKGYDPTTGEVTKPAGSGVEAALSSTLEGIPVAGPILQTGVENAAAGIGSAISGKPFSQVRSEMGDIVDKSQEDHPYITAAGNVGGAVLGTIPMVMAAPAAFGVGMSLPAATAMGGVSGAALGGADAAVRSGGDAKEALKGAAWGGVLGAVAPTAGKIIGSAVGSIANRVRAPGMQSPTGAQRAISRAAGSDAIDDVAARLADAGDAAMPMDLGPNLQRQAGALAATPGRGQEIIRSAIANRQSGAGSRITQALDNALGQPVDTLAVADDIIAKRAAASKPLYDAALGKDVPFTPELKELISRPSVGRALKKAQALAADEGASRAAAPTASAPVKPRMSAEDAIAKLNRRAAGQERRAVNAITPSAGPKPARPMRLSEFIAAQGGILDHAGEAASIAGGAKTRFGRLVRPDGKRTLDYMREAAEEAGYLGNYTSDEFGRASVDDLLRALDDDLRGSPVYAQENLTEAGMIEAWEAAQAARSSARNSADRVGQELSGSIDDDVFERATRLVEDGMPSDEALQRAIADDIAENGIPPQEVPAGWFAEVGEDGAVKVRRPPNTRELHYTKMALDDMIQTAKQSGNANEARVYTQLKERLLGMMDTAVPEYAAARKEYSGPSSILNAMEEGRAVFSKQTTPAQMLREMAQMSAAEREAYLQAGRAQIADIMGTARNDALAARTTFSTGYNKEKLALLVGKDKAAQLLRSLDNEALFTRTRDIVTGNSETAARAAAMQEVGAGAKSPGLFRNAANMRFGDVVAGLGDKVFGSMRTAAQDKLNEELARILTSSGSIGEALKVSQAAQARGEITAAQARLIANSILQAASPSRNAMVISPQVSGGL